MSKTIRELIDVERDVYSVDAAQSIRHVVAYMCDKNIGAVAVLDGGKVAGVFSERDLLRRVVTKGLDLDKVSVRDVMSSPVLWISIDERHEVARTIMVDKGFRHLVVMGDQDKFYGFVSSRELLEAGLSESRGLVSKLNDDYYGRNYKP